MKKIYVAILMASALAFVQAQAPDAGDLGDTGVIASDDFDSLFDDPSSAVIEEAPVVENPESAVFESDPFMWAGDFSSAIGVNAGYPEMYPSFKELADPTERLSVDIGARLWFDARPDKNFRVFGKFTTDYPFTAKVLDEDSETYTTNNIKLFELFSDFNWDEKVFFRFGKQTAGWGLSQFYQIADPLTVGVKDPSDPTADLEGPLALKIALPFGVHNFYFYSVVKESYLPENLGEASVSDLGVGLKADFLLTVPENAFLGNADVTIGAYTQRDLSPKAVAGLSTAVGDFQIFTDQTVSWGFDSYRLTNDRLQLPSGQIVYDTEKSDDGLFYSATAGTMYVNNDWYFTFYGEYMFSSSASSDSKYLEKWITRYYAENPSLVGMSETGLKQTLVFSDISGYQSRHNSGFSLSWSELFGTDKLGFSALWLQNWVDMSGMLKPTLTFTPFEHLTFESSATVVWGTNLSEWVIKNSDPVSQERRRLIGYFGVKIGGGKF